VSIPFIDPLVKHEGFTFLRNIDKKQISETTYVIHDGISKPILVILPYKVYMELQELLELVPAKSILTLKAGVGTS
jgi:hypothetical protein